MTNNNFMKFIDHFQIGIVIFKDYKHPKQIFKDDDKYLISDCSFDVTKERHLFEYCNYFMILGVLIRSIMIYFTIWSLKEQYNRLKNERKESLSVECVISKIYFISLVKKR